MLARSALHSPQATGVLDRGPMVGHLARVLGGLELGQQIAQLGAGNDSELGRELVAAEERLRRPVTAPIERCRQHRPGEAEVRLDRLLRRERAATERRSATVSSVTSAATGSVARRYS